MYYYDELPLDSLIVILLVSEVNLRLTIDT